MATKSELNMTLRPSVNALSQPLLARLLAQMDALNIGVSQHVSGASIIDAGISHKGSTEAGRLIAEICMGGLGKVNLRQDATFKNWPSSIYVQSAQPVLACLGSQYAGWSLQHDKFFSLGSGPARAIAQREDLFKELNYQDSAEKTVLVLETDKIPPRAIIEKVARDTKVKAEDLTFILTPTTSLAGATQIAARVLEVALHKAHTLHFPLAYIVSGSGTAPLPPASSDFLSAMGRTNDAILFGGFVQLTVNCDDDVAQKLAESLPSSASKDYGKTFAEVFRFYDKDFYQIDPLLFSPAKVQITNLATGSHFSCGAFNEALIDQSFNN